jgi:hypothetical protein
LLGQRVIFSSCKKFIFSKIRNQKNISVNFYLNKDYN